MKLYNTPGKTVEEIEPQNPPQVTVYTCGPTVYDYPHIGNWFTFIRYDVLIRSLKATGYQPKWVMNITDVGHLVSDADDGEDKLEKGAKREGKTAWEVAEFYTDDFKAGLDKLNFLQPDVMPKATEHIPEQISLIETLEAKDYTYVIDDGVYFDTSKFSQYADFANLNLAEQDAGARVEVNPQKRNQSDFALWKFSPTNQKRDMEWDSPWGKGFPGWHLECSAMAMKYLGQTIDIHAGGIDHIPVHHTNEIAQSVAATGQPFAHYWMHANHILVEGQKISKSLGNGITLGDIEAKSFTPLDVRMLGLESHYHSQAQFSWEALQSARNRLRNLSALADLRFQAVSGDDADGHDFKSYQAELLKCLEDDLNTPQALALLSRIGSEIEYIQPKDMESFVKFLESVDSLLGLRLLNSNDIEQEAKELLEQRASARQSNDWPAADKIRDELYGRGIGIRDTSHGQIWFRL